MYINYAYMIFYLFVYKTHNFNDKHANSVCFCLRMNIIHYVNHYVLVLSCYQEWYVLYFDVKERWGNMG